MEDKIPNKQKQTSKPASGESGLNAGLEAAPTNSLPTWKECRLIIDNHEFRQRAARGLEGQVLDTTPTTPPPTELEKFIHEYDDANSYKSAWFMHRLEMVIKEAKHEASNAEIRG